MSNLPALRRKAVSYAVSQITDGSDLQEIEHDILNLEQFSPLIASFDPDFLYDEVVEILEEAQDTFEYQRDSWW